jgi:hypothetical protein
MADNLYATGPVGDDTPAEPFTITITAAQVELLLGPKQGR